MTKSIGKSFLIDPLTTNNAIYCDSLILSTKYNNAIISFRYSVSFKNVAGEAKSVTGEWLQHGLKLLGQSLAWFTNVCQIRPCIYLGK